ncbi:hypothetical protein TrVE_jg6721 [Triparma verrucosa]|nr:hypothetical protein TrVE_jg6721 [Triparma verrucosa]
MVSTTLKPLTTRTAVATATLHFPPSITSLLSSNSNRTSKGSITDISRYAGISASKKTSSLIPLCHQINLTDCNVTCDVIGSTCHIKCTVTAFERTGVEMEAMVGASVAALTVYDMVKGVSHEVVIGEVKLMEKKGGKRVVEDGKNVT